MKDSFSKSQVTLKDFLLILFHRKKYFLLPALIVFFTATIGSFFLPKYYLSSVLILVQAEKVINPLSTDQRPYSVSQQTNIVEQLKTFSEKILNFRQLISVVQKVGQEAQITNPLEREKLLKSIRQRTKIRLRSPEVLEVNYEDKDPKMAQRLVNSLVETFIEYNRMKKEQLALTGVKFGEDQAEVYRKKLEESEQALSDHQEKYSLQKPGKDTEINVSLLINYQTSLTNTQLSVEEGKQLLRRLKNQINGKEPVLMSQEFLLANPIIESLNESIKVRQLQLDDMMHRDPSSGRITDLELEIGDFSRRLLEETEKIVDTQTQLNAPLFYKQLEQQKSDLEMHVRNLRKKEKELTDLVNEYSRRIATLPEQDRIYAELQRDNRVNNNIYEMLRFKVEENRLDAIELQQKGTRYDILEEGRLPLKPSKPQKLLIAIVALVLGVLTGFFCVFFVERGDHSFRNVEDARKYLDIPVISSTIKIMSKKDFKKLQQKKVGAMLLILIAFILFVVVAVTSSYVQDKKLTERIIREQMQED